MTQRSVTGYINNILNTSTQNTQDIQKINDQHKYYPIGGIGIYKKKNSTETVQFQFGGYFYNGYIYLPNSISYREFDGVITAGDYELQDCPVKEEMDNYESVSSSGNWNYGFSPLMNTPSTYVTWDTTKGFFYWTHPGTINEVSFMPIGSANLSLKNLIPCMQLIYPARRKDGKV